MAIARLLKSIPRLFTLGAHETVNASEVKGLVSSVDTITAARYDTLENPRGTDHVVATGKKLYITEITLAHAIAAGTEVRVEIGYGDDGVGNSVAAPTANKVVWGAGSLVANGNPIQMKCLAIIPAGKYPYIRAITSGFGVSCHGSEF